MKRIAAIVVALMFVATPVLAQEGELRITQPASQTGVTEGDTIDVQGDGCPASSPVLLTFNEEPVGETESDSAGRFSAEVTIPRVETPDDVVESSEASLAAECGGERASVVLAVGAREELAFTGSNPAVPAAVGVALLGLGFVILRLRRPHGSPH